jgi:hypothetical protein
MIVSDWAMAETASAIAMKVRTGALAVETAREALVDFDSWVAVVGSQEAVVPGDIAAAANFLRRFDLPLKAPDALHIAVCRRLGAGLLTFDTQMALAAARLGCTVLPA